MKLKTLLFSALFLSSAALFAQEVEQVKKNELSISPFVLIAGGVNVSYERLLDKDQSVGADVFIVPDEFSQVAPYYRFYFGKKYSNGFFMEGFLPILNTDYNKSVYYYDTSIDDYIYSNSRSVNRTLIGAGFGIGGKWVLKKNLVLEVSGGMGRMIGSFEDYDEDFITGKGKIGIGFRF